MYAARVRRRGSVASPSVCCCCGRSLPAPGAGPRSSIVRLRTSTTNDVEPRRGLRSLNQPGAAAVGRWQHPGRSPRSADPGAPRVFGVLARTGCREGRGSRCRTRRRCHQHLGRRRQAAGGRSVSVSAGSDSARMKSSKPVRSATRRRRASGESKGIAAATGPPVEDFCHAAACFSAARFRGPPDYRWTAWGDALAIT